MTPRQRVLAAVGRERPDRVPRDFWAEEPSWRRLLAHLGHDDRRRVLAHLGHDDRRRVLDDLGIDIRHLEVATPPERRLEGGVHQNFWGERFVYNVPTALENCYF